MVRWVIEIMYKEIRGLHQAAYVLAVFAFGSQLLALVRDRLLAHEFGAGIQLDIYYTAFRIPDFLYVLFASMLSVYVLIPFITDRLNTEKDGSYEKAREFLSQIMSLFLVGYSVLALCLFVAVPYLTSVLFPGFENAYREELVMLTRILLLQPLFLGVSSLFGVVTQVGGRFVLYAISPLLYNIGIIIGVMFFFPVVGLWGLVVGVVLGAIMHMVVQIPFIRGSKLVPTVTQTFDWKRIREVLAVSIPRAVTLSLHQLVFVVLVGVASVMAIGSVSVFQFAYNLQSVPLAIIGVSYSVAAFPTLAKLFSKGERDAFITHVFSALRHILFWSIPAAALIIVLRAQIVRVILGSGAFDWEDTRLTAAALALFSISLIAQAVNLLIVRAFYASGNTRIPLTVTLISSIASVLFALGFYQLFLMSDGFRGVIEFLMRVQDVPGTEVLALPLGYSVALLLHTIVLLTLFNKAQDMQLSRLTASFFRAVAAGLMAGVGAYITINLLVDGLKTDTFIGIFLQGLIGGIVGILSAAVLLYVARSPEFLEAVSVFKNKLGKKQIIPAEQNVDDPAS